MKSAERRGDRTRRVALHRGHVALWALLAMCLVQEAAVIALGLPLMYVIGMGALCVLSVFPPLYRSAALLDRDARTVTIERSVLIAWRGAPIRYDGHVRVRRGQSGSAGDGARYEFAVVVVGGVDIAKISQEQAQAAADEIRSFFADA